MAALRDYARRVLRPDAGHDAGFCAAVRALLADPARAADMDAFVARAHARLPAAPPADAARWRTLYTDAAVLKALALGPAAHEHDARARIAALDRAIIVAGAGADDSRRDYVVHDVIGQLQSAIPRRPPGGAVLAAQSAPAVPLGAARSTVRTLAALPSITAQKQWCQTPFLARGHAAHWPAVRRWVSLDYLHSVAGPGRIVPVEVGDDYRSDDWSQKLMGWEDFLCLLEPSSSHQTVYLAQHSLLTQFPRLRQDIVLPDIVYASLDAPDYRPPPDVIINAWLGPQGTVSPAHTDPFFNCYVQVVGRKTVWLAPPHVAPAMYPHQMGNTSQVDVFAPETEQFPSFWASVPEEAACVTLGPGDLLFFPPGWWHAMRSEDVSFSVSMWF